MHASVALGGGTTSGVADAQALAHRLAQEADRPADVETVGGGAIVGGTTRRGRIACDQNRPEPEPHRCEQQHREKWSRYTYM